MTPRRRAPALLAAVTGALLTASAPGQEEAPSPRPDAPAATEDGRDAPSAEETAAEERRGSEPLPLDRADAGSDADPPARDPFAAADAGLGPAPGEGEAGDGRSRLHLHGLLILEDEAPGALLGVGEERHVVRSGETLAVGAPADPLRLRVEEVGRSGVVVRLGEGGPRVRVR